MLSSKDLVLPLLVSSFLFLPAAFGQAQPRIAQVVFDHPGSFTQEQLAAISGVKPGDPATAATLQAGAQKLSDTGFFDDVGAEIRGSAMNLVAVFELKPTPRAAMLPVGFENFVWLTPQEMDAAIHGGVTLYSGYLPETGVQVDAVVTALQRALAAKGVTAVVEHETVEPTLEHPLRTMEFRVTMPRPVVANIKLAGVTPELVPLVQKSVNATAHKSYDAGLSGALTAESILAPLLDAGYIDASLGGVSVEEEAQSGSVEPVIVHAVLSPGEVYHVSALSFAGAPLMTSEAFLSGAKLHAGDVASRAALLATLVPLDAAYRSRGYMDVIVKADPAESSATHQVAYTVSVIPGEQYRLAKVSAEGLDPAAHADFGKYFKLKPGDLYDPVYVAGFIRNNTALRSLAPYTGAFKAYADPNKHTVDLVVSFFGRTDITVH